MQQETTLLSFPRRYGTSEIIKEKKNMARHDWLYPEGKGWKKMFELLTRQSVMLWMKWTTVWSFQIWRISYQWKMFPYQLYDVFFMCCIYRKADVMQQLSLRKRSLSFNASFKRDISGVVLMILNPLRRSCIWWKKHILW